MVSCNPVDTEESETFFVAVQNQTLILPLCIHCKGEQNNRMCIHCKKGVSLSGSSVTSMLEKPELYRLQNIRTIRLLT